MLDDKRLAIIKLLMDRTSAGQLKWAATADDNTFQVAMGDYSVSIKSGPGEAMDSTDFVFEIANEEGRVIDQFRDTELGNRMPDTMRSDFYSTVAVLFDMARGAALGVNEALDAVLKELTEMDLPDF